MPIFNIATVDLQSAPGHDSEIFYISMLKL